MKYQILAGTLGLVLLLGLSPLPQAEAKMFLIDDFSGDPTPVGIGACDLTTNGNTNAPFLSALQNVIDVGLLIRGVLGDWRECSINLDVENDPSEGAIQVVGAPDDGGAGTTPEMFRHMAGTGVETISMLTYDADGAGLGVNLLNSDDVRIVYSTSDFQVDVTVRVTDSGGDWDEQIASTVAGTVSTPTEILFDIGNFVIAPSASMGVLNLKDIDGIKFTFDTTTAFTDYDLDLLDITMEMVGGEMFPVDTTALLLAGAELNAIWILPAIAAIGIGAFIVSRKRN